jgi:small subunit ribosomal protein S17
MPLREFQGIITSDKRDKTVTIQVDTMVRHPVYKKFVKRTSRFSAHDEANEYKEGDTVVVQECKPFSKTKTWRVIRKVS